MSLASKGNLLLLTCSDKVLRLADVQQRPADAKPVSKEEAEAKLSTLGVSGEVASATLVWCSVVFCVYVSCLLEGYRLHCSHTLKAFSSAQPCW